MCQKSFRTGERRPYTFVVFSVLVLILGCITAVVTPKDIFPYIDIPVVSIVWTYNGLTPDDMEKRVVTICERAMTTTRRARFDQMDCRPF